MLDDEAFASLRIRVYSTLELETFLAMEGVAQRRRHLERAFGRMAFAELLDVVELLLEYDHRLSGV